MNNWNLRNKKAIVTGGSKGIGKAIVKELLGLGAEVLFTARQEHDLKSAHKEFENLGWKTHILCGHVQDSSHQNQIKKWIEDNWGTLDILVNNAGMNIRKPSSEYSMEEYARVLDTNLTAPFELSRLLFSLLKKSGAGSVINIASVAGSFDALTGAPYGMSKAGLLQLTRNLAKEWARFNIRVNSVSPWFTETPLTSGLLSDEKKLRAIEARTPLGRVAKDAEIAAAVAFLALDKASFITGQNLSVDGGASISIL
jgi:Tropinone reductase 1